MNRYFIILMVLLSVTSYSSQKAYAESLDDASMFAIAVEICLSHMVDRSPMHSFQENGFNVVSVDEGTFNIEATGITGFIAPLLPTDWCWLKSQSLTLQQIQGIVFQEAVDRFPQGVTGPAQRGDLANGCPSIGLAYTASRYTLLEFRTAGFFNGCDADQPGGVLFK